MDPEGDPVRLILETLAEKRPPGSLQGPNWLIFLDRPNNNNNDNIFPNQQLYNHCRHSQKKTSHMGPYIGQVIL